MKGNGKKHLGLLRFEGLSFKGSARVMGLVRIFSRSSNVLSELLGLGPDVFCFSECFAAPVQVIRCMQDKMILFKPLRSSICGLLFSSGCPAVKDKH